MLTGISKKSPELIHQTYGEAATYSHKDGLHSDWPFHLWAVNQMVPYFFASAHVD